MFLFAAYPLLHAASRVEGVAAALLLLYRAICSVDSVLLIWSYRRLPAYTAPTGGVLVGVAGGRTVDGCGRCCYRLAAARCRRAAVVVG